MTLEDHDFKRIGYRIQPGTWGIPAGKVEAGETPLQAAIRETREEVGIDLTPENIEYHGDLYVSTVDASPLNIKFSIYAIYMSHRPEVTLEAGQEGFCWLSLENALKLPLFTGSREVLLLGMK